MATRRDVLSYTPSWVAQEHFVGDDQGFWSVQLYQMGSVGKVSREVLVHGLGRGKRRRWVRNLFDWL
jgi:hypothetical protein